MTNNDVLRQIRYIFDFNDKKMIDLFNNAGLKVTRSQVSNWLKKEEVIAYEELTDHKMAFFLNGFINDRRGKKEGPEPEVEQVLNNNIIFRKLKIALNLRNEDVIELFNLVDLRVGKAELTALFRNENHRKYRLCKDQFLRNFLHGVQKKYRDSN